MSRPALAADAREPVLTDAVCIVVPTFRRVHQLRLLLEAIARLSVPPGLSLEAAVIDNDGLRTAEAVVREAALAFPFRLHYVIASEPGLSMVRNHALSFVRDRFDFMAMIDDDEVPEPQWLLDLSRVQRATGADVVVGPVAPIVPPNAPRWIVSLREKETPKHRDGAVLGDGWSCNALVRLATVARLDVRFDPALNFTGGEDQLFFRQVLAGGGTIVYAAGATVREHVDGSRLTLRFNLLRAFRRGNSLSFCDRQMYGTRRAAAIRAVKGLARIAKGGLSLVPLFLVRGVSGVVIGLCEIATGAGMIAGLVGSMYQAYRRSDERA